MADFTPKPPDFTLSVLDKNKDQQIKGPIGCAWLQQDGTIRIKVNPLVVLDTRAGDYVLTLFPVVQSRNNSDKPVKKRVDYPPSPPPEPDVDF